MVAKKRWDVHPFAWDGVKELTRPVIPSEESAFVCFQEDKCRCFAEFTLSEANGLSMTADFSHLLARRGASRTAPSISVTETRESELGAPRAHLSLRLWAVKLE
jgi:hypothetical protein